MSTENEYNLNTNQTDPKFGDGDNNISLSSLACFYHLYLIRYHMVWPRWSRHWSHGTIAKSKSVAVDLSSLSFICLYDCERHLDSQILTAATDNWIWDQTQFFINSSCVKVQSSLSRSIYHMQNEDVRGYMILFTGT